MHLRTTSPTRDDAVRTEVRNAYAKAATATSSCCGPSCCGAPAAVVPNTSARIGYSADEIAQAPEGANLGLGCGNPQTIAALQPGETVLDLGAGAGFDCFLAARRVGPSGRVIGVDMTPEMLSRARANAAKGDYANVEFRLGEIERLPVADQSVDVVISNCVINLSPDKPQVWREIARVLKPGARVAVSDLALLKPLPPAVLQDIEALVGCVAGASLIDDVRAAVLDAGLTDLEMTAKPQYIEAMTNWEDPLYKRIAEALPAGSTMSDYVVSLDIAARRR